MGILVRVKLYSFYWGIAEVGTCRMFFGYFRVFDTICAVLCSIGDIFLGVANYYRRGGVQCEQPRATALCARGTNDSVAKM